MKYFIAFTMLLFVCNSIADLSLDDKLRIAAEVNSLRPKDCSITQYDQVTEDEFNNGKQLFESKILSGDKDIGCQDCHLDEFNSTDGLPLAVGVSGEGKGEERYIDGKGILVQRNAFSLKGRGNPQFVNYFWDGKIDTDKSGKFVSQFGEFASNKFLAPLSVASILPLIERDEFMGKTAFFAENDVQYAVGDKLYQQRYLAISKAIRKRILTDDDPEVKAIRNSLAALQLDMRKLELADLGNLIGKFIATNFPCQESGWDRYLSGNKDALTMQQKNGALLFYGKARCSVCHSGNLQSDFLFHSIGTPQGMFGPHSRHRDLGRAGVTLRQEDLFKFRTPPLIEVSGSPPFGHNGIFSTLKEVVVHHINPVQLFVEGKIESTYEYGKILDSRDKVLSSISVRSEEEVDSIVSFLESL